MAPMERAARRAGDADSSIGRLLAWLSHRMVSESSHTNDALKSEADELPRV